ncbi:MAG: CUB domain-containing protein, partial [Flavobacteriales bacterium]
MLKRILPIFALLVLFASDLLSQTTYRMKDTTVEDCDGILTDSEALFVTGGLGYDRLENFEFSICPGTGATIYFTFSFLELEPGNDTIFFYDGPDTNSPLIISFTGSPVPIPGLITSTSGCLTVHFRSDGSLQKRGWISSWNTLAPLVTAPELNVSATEPPACDSLSFLIELDRNIHCDSLVSSNITFTGYNPPTVTNITKVGCANDSSQFARIWLNTPFVYNCEYVMNMNINIPDICDSVYNFDLKD